VKIFKIYSLILILIVVFFAQPVFSIAMNSELKLAANDTIAYLDIPDRPVDAIEGLEFTNQIRNLGLRDREKAIVEQILSGNVPSFSRRLKPLKINQRIGSTNYELIFFTVMDYMAIGSEQDYLYVPMTPSTAQYLADRLNCSLPTKKIVDVVYTNADIKLDPQPIPPSSQMTTVPVFNQHTDSIKQQISKIGLDRSADNIIAGHKKDIIISNKIYSLDRSYERVVIYGWHLSNNNPIQPVYNGHIASYADYSHGVRLISNIAFVNEDSTQLTDILRDAGLSALLSSEGVISKPYYPPSDFLTSMGSRSDNFKKDFKLSQNYPNPFNPTTTINYQLKTASDVKITVYDISGREIETIVNHSQNVGKHSVVFNASDFSSGVYIYTLKTGTFEQNRKMLLLR